MDILDILLDILLKPPQPLMGLFLTFHALNSNWGVFLFPSLRNDPGFGQGAQDQVYRILGGRLAHGHPICSLIWFAWASVNDIPEIVFSSGVCKDVMATAWRVDESFDSQTMSPLFPLSID